ncbi:MAG: oligosaccharide flippase family protein [Solirubrobacteraceae bacterium]
MFASGAGQVALVASGICAARILGVQDRGQLALFVLVPMILTVLGALGVPVAITYFIARDPSNAKGVVSAVRQFSVTQTAGIMTFHFVILICLYHDASTSLQIAAATTLLVVPTKLAQDYGNAILQGQQRFRAFNITRCLPAFAYAASILAVFIIGGGHLLAVTLCYVISTAAAGIATLTVAVRNLPVTQSPERNPHVKELVKFGSKALLGAVYPTETFQIDQAFVGLFLSRIALGTYVVGVSFTNLPRFMAQSVGLVAYPNVAGTSNKREARKKVWRFFWLVFAISLVICGSLEFLTPILVPFLFGSAFRASVGITQILLIGSFIVSIRRVLSDGMRGVGYPILGSLAEVTGLLLLIPALIVLIPTAGITGAATAMPVAAAGGLIVLLIGVAITGRRDAKRYSGEVHTVLRPSLGQERAQQASYLAVASTVAQGDEQ